MVEGFNKFIEGLDMASILPYAVVAILALWCWLIIRLGNIQTGKVVKKAGTFTSKRVGRFIRKKELDYARDNEIGIVKRDGTRHKIYTFLNDLTIDLGLKLKGCSPYELSFFIFLITVAISLVLSSALDSLMFGVLSFPIVFFGVVCTLYTKANAAHAARIGAIIEAENIICNNIGAGVKVAVRNSINSFPKEVKNEFQDYLNELNDSTHPVVALQHLNDKLGSVSDSFIANCIQFEMNASQGTADTFQDIVEMNAYMNTVRLKMNSVFEAITNEFLMCIGVIGVAFGGVLAIYPFIRNFYFNTVIGNILLLVDLSLVVLYFVIITYYRAQSYFGD